MKPLRRILLSSSLGMLMPVLLQAQPFAAEVDSVLQLMTLEEKIGQMNQYNGFWKATGPVPEGGNPLEKYEELRQGAIGAVLNVQGVAEVRALQRIAVEQTRLGIPLLFGCDVIHGYKTLSPIPLAEAASWDLAAIEASARFAAQEATAAGINWTFAPMVDISRDPRWGRVMEGAGEDPYLGARIAEARVRGFQGEDLSQPHTLAACAKHFAGYGFVQAGRDYHHTDFSAFTLYNTILPPFQAARDAGVATFMNAFTSYNGIPSSADSFLMRQILKQAWDYEGFVVSDWGSIQEMIAHGYAASLSEAAVLAAEAGCDMDMESQAYVRHLAEAVRDGRVAEARIDEAVGRILRLKFALGLFDDPYRYCDEAREKAVIGSEAIHAAAFTMAQKSMVLLENKGVLPLQPNEAVVLLGALAEDRTAPLGNWRVSADNGTAIPLTEGLRKYFPGLAWAPGPKAWDGPEVFHLPIAVNHTDTTGWAAAMQLAQTANTLVVALGEHGYQSGEGRSRTSIRLPGLQEDFLRALVNQHPRVVLVLFAGRPLIIPDDIRTRLGALLLAWQPGTHAGDAVASVLMGDFNPSGRLPMTFPRHEGQIPLAYNDYTGGRPGPSQEVFWSHFNDLPNTPLYPFGYGLSYSVFQYGEPMLTKAKDGSLSLSVAVTNVSKRAGTETVQLYYRRMWSKHGVPPAKELAGFQQIQLAPGATKTVQFAITAADLRSFDAHGVAHAAQGEVRFWLAPNSGVEMKHLTFVFE